MHDILTNSNQYLLQACDKGFQGDYEPIRKWFSLLLEHSSLIVKLFKEAYKRNSSVEVSLVLSSIRCGLYSQKESVCLQAITLLTRIA